MHAANISGHFHHILLDLCSLKGIYVLFVTKLTDTCMYVVLCSDKDKQAFEAWHAHDDAEDNFCELDG